jgi:predicted nucleotidyltransferase
MLGGFGSVARDEATAKSDIDLLTEASISPYIRDNILNDLQVLYVSQ